MHRDNTVIPQQQHSDRCWTDECPRLQAHLEGSRPNTRYQRFLTSHDAEPWTHRAIFIETGGHDIHTELKRAWLVKNCLPHAGPTSVIHVDTPILIMRQ